MSQDRLAEAHGAPRGPKTQTPEGHAESQIVLVAPMDLADEGGSLPGPTVMATAEESRDGSTKGVLATPVAPWTTPDRHQVLGKVKHPKGTPASG